MQSGPAMRELLRQGDHRTNGSVAAVVRSVLHDPSLTSGLVEGLFDAEDGARMRAADALEKISRQRTEELQAYTHVLVGLLEETEQQEVQWHLAVLLPRLHLTARERQRTIQALQRCMDSRSSIVKTFALQGLFDLAVQEPSLMPLVTDLLASAEKTGTPAMKTRSRKLLQLVARRVTVL